MNRTAKAPRGAGRRGHRGHLRAGGQRERRHARSPHGACQPPPPVPAAGFSARGAGLPAFNPAGLSFVGPSVGAVATVIGPTVITTAPSTFINTNIQTSAGSNLSGGQG